MVKDHSDSEKGNPLPPHRLLFLISSKGYFTCTIPQTGYTHNQPPPPNGAVAKSMANKLVGTGFGSRYLFQPTAGF